MFRTIFDEKKKLWHSPQIKMTWTEEPSLGTKLLKAFKSNGPNVAQICAITNETRTYEELRRLTVRAAMNMQKFGCERGRKILLLSATITNVAPLYFGAICLGCPLVAMPISSSEAECEHFMSITKPEFAICQVEFYSMIKRCFAKLKIKAKIFTIDGQAGDSISSENFSEKVDGEDDFEAVKLDVYKDILYILRTGGTTGLSKGVLLSHATFLDKMESLRHTFKSTDVVVKLAHLASIAAVRCFLGAALFGGKYVMNAGPFSPKRYFELTERFHGTTIYASIYEIMQMLHDPGLETANLDSLTSFQCGSGYVSLEIIHRFGKYLKNAKICNHFGMTEAGGTIACNFEHVRNNSVGQLLCNHQAKIVNDNGERLGINEIGEFCIKFPIPFLGYIGKENEMHLFIDDEGFYMTGDEARFDENGDLFIDDRKKEVFKSHGAKVSPAQIEAFINNIDGVKESCVVPVPSELYGNLPTAVVVKSHNSTVTEQIIYDSVSNHFAVTKRLDGGIYFIDKFPINSTGKVARPVVKQMALEFYNNRHKPAATS